MCLVKGAERRLKHSEGGERGRRGKSEPGRADPRGPCSETQEFGLRLGGTRSGWTVSFEKPYHLTFEKRSLWLLC